MQNYDQSNKSILDRKTSTNLTIYNFDELIFNLSGYPYNIMETIINSYLRFKTKLSAHQNCIKYKTIRILKAFPTMYKAYEINQYSEEIKLFHGVIVHKSHANAKVCLT